MRRMTETARGVPMDRIREAFDHPGRRVRRGPDEVSFLAPWGRTRVMVQPPSGPSLDETAMSAIVRVRASLPFAGLTLADEQLMPLNWRAALGAVVRRGAGYAVESRLTTYAGHNPWMFYLPLIQAAGLLGAEAIAGDEVAVADDAPIWSGDELPAIAEEFARVCCCNGDPGGLTAEIPLRPGLPSAMFGSVSTALVRVLPDSRHPALGNGLHARLELPHQFRHAKELADVVSRLNEWDLQGEDLPPHFGAWCEGSVSNPCYTLFWPASLYQPGLTRNIVVWLRARAVLADGYLLAHGIEDDALSADCRGARGGDRLAEGGFPS